jgi:uncharacterized membrane protein
MATVSTMPRVRIRKIGTEDLRWALSAGWRDFQEKRGDLIFVALIYPLIGLVAAVAAFNDAALPLFFPAVAGLSLLGPAVAAGFYELARRREAQLESTWRHFFDPLSGPGRDTLIMLTVGLMVIFGVWIGFAYAIYAALLGPDLPHGIAAFFTRVFTTPEGWAMMLLGNIVGAFFATIVLVCTVVSFPMAVDRAVDPATALNTSIRAARANPAMMIGWGWRVIGLLALGCLPAFIGLAVVLPVLGYATWHLYTRLVERG